MNSAAESPESLDVKSAARIIIITVRGAVTAFDLARPGVVRMVGNPDRVGVEQRILRVARNSYDNTIKIVTSAMRPMH
jgi:hypothetical protein